MKIHKVKNKTQKILILRLFCVIIISKLNKADEKAKYVIKEYIKERKVIS